MIATAPQSGQACVSGTFVQTELKAKSATLMQLVPMEAFLDAPDARGDMLRLLPDLVQLLAVRAELASLQP